MKSSENRKVSDDFKGGLKLVISLNIGTKIWR